MPGIPEKDDCKTCNRCVYSTQPNHRGEISRCDRKVLGKNADKKCIYPNDFVPRQWGHKS